MKKNNRALGLSLVAISFLSIAFAYAVGPTKVNMGNTDNFAILAGSAITNIGSSVINGDVGIYPGTAVTGFPPAVLNGTQHVNDTQAINAKSGLTSVYLDASSRTPVSTIPTELGGSTRNPGVYDSQAGTFNLTGTLTLDAQGDPNAVFIFKTASTLITSSNSNIVLAGGAQACNVFWVVGSSATLGTNSNLQGSIMALTSVTLTTGAHVDGRVMAQNGAVTLDSSTVVKPSCIVTTPTTTTATATIFIGIPVATTTVQSTTSVLVITQPVITFTPVQAVVPKLPNAGFAPAEDNASSTTAVAVIALSVAVLFFATRKKLLF